MKILESKLAAQKSGVLYLLENGFLSNQDHTGAFPAGEPVEYFLFMGVGKSGDSGYEWFIHTITALNQKTADEEVRNIGDREDVILIESRRTLNVIQKDWQGKKHAQTI